MSSNRKVFMFLSTATTTAIVISWGSVCLVYLYIRRRVGETNLEKKNRNVSISSLQPGLAIWGLGWSFFIGTLPKLGS